MPHLHKAEHCAETNRCGLRSSGRLRATLLSQVFEHQRRVANRTGDEPDTSSDAQGGSGLLRTKVFGGFFGPLVGLIATRVCYNPERWISPLKAASALLLAFG